MDDELRRQLFLDPEATARTFNLQDSEMMALRLLDHQKFEEKAVLLRWG